jgi:coatomer subunit gamma
MLNLSFPQSSEPVELTEAETEYAVNVVKHIYENHVVLQYNCTNTIPEQLLEDVSTGPLSILLEA